MPDPFSVTRTTEAAGSQDGWIVAGVWNESSTVFGPCGFGGGGFPVISFGLQFVGFRTYSGGLALGPNRILGATLQLTTDIAFVADVNVQVSVLNERAPAPYSTSLAPGSRSSEVLIYDVTHVAAGQTQLSIPLTSSVPNGVGGTTTILNETLRNLLAPSEWPGPLSFTVRIGYVGAVLVNFFTAEHATGTPQTLITSELASNSGWATDAGPERAASAVHSMRSGFPTLSDELVEDGYLPGIWVRESEQDPPDEFERDTYVPNPDEGSGTDIPAS